MTDDPRAMLGRMGESYPYGDIDRAEVLPYVPATARWVLDVGCSFGGFGAAVKRERPDAVVWGIEPNPAAAGAAEGRLDRVIRGPFPPNDGDLLAGRFDCVTFNDVLEHMADPWAALRHTQRLLAPGGAVVASLPNVRHITVLSGLLRGHWTYEESGILDRTHLRFFTRRSACAMFDSAGYDVQRVGFITYDTGGRRYRVLKAFGESAREFRAMQFVVVATPSSPQR